MSTRARLLRSCAGLALALAAGLVPRAHAADFRLAYSSNPGSLPIYVADELGYFSAEGVTVRRVACDVGRECLNHLIGGQADLATTADLPLVIAAFAGQRFSVVATLNTNRDDTKIVARRSGPVQRVADLAGRRVATLVGTTASYAFESKLLYEGVDPARVEVVGLAPAELRAALLARRVDAVAVFEPHAFELKEALGSDALVLGSPRIYNQTWNLIAPPSGAAPRAEALAAVLRALHRACGWIAAQPQAARSLLARRTGLSTELAESLWPYLSYGLELRQSLLTTMEAEARWLLRSGSATGPAPNVLQFIDTRPLRALQPTAVTVVD